MLKQTLTCTVLAGLVFTASNFASAGGLGTNEEAKAMLGRAIAEVKSSQDEAIKKFNSNDSRFRDRDLFVFCFNRRSGKLTAHQSMVGWDVRTLYDPWGSPFGEEMFAVKPGDTIEISYLAPLDGSRDFAAKRAYVAAVGDQTCGVSAYQPAANAKLGE